MKTAIKGCNQDFEKVIDIPEAEIFGELALHRTIKDDASLYGGWSITHVRTGGVVWRHNSVRKAKKAVKALAQLDWSKLKTGKEKKVIAKLRPLRAAILQAIEESK
jgi:hypothetical protein